MHDGEIESAPGTRDGRSFGAFALLCDASAPDQLSASPFNLEARSWVTGSVVAHLYWRPKVPRSPLCLSISFSLSFSLSISLYLCLSQFLSTDTGLCWILPVLVSVHLLESIIENDECIIIFSDTNRSTDWFNQFKNQSISVFLPCFSSVVVFLKWNAKWIIGQSPGRFCWIAKNSLDSFLFFWLILQSDWFSNLVDSTIWLLWFLSVCVCSCQCASVWQCVSVCAPREDNTTNVDY